MAEFDPSQPYESVTEQPKAPPAAFDPNQPFQEAPKQEPAKNPLDVKNLPFKEEPMPGVMTAIGQGLTSAAGDIGQSYKAVTGDKPEPIHENSPAAQPFEWADALQPIDRGLPKVAYRFAKSSPALATGIAGGVAGGAAGSAIAPGVGTTVGGLGGGVLGSAAGAAFQTIGPVFAQELKKTPNDPDAAWDRALKDAEISGAFAGVGWALFPARFFQGPLKQLAFQAFGIQPLVGMSEKMAKNALHDKPLGEGLGEAYVESAVGTSVPAAGHQVLSHVFRPNEVPPQNPQKNQFIADANQKLNDAQALDAQSNAAGITPQQKADLRRQASDLRQEAQSDFFMAKTPPEIDDVGRFQSIRRWWKNNVQPEMWSDKALQADPLFAKYKSASAQEKDAIIARAEENYYKWNKIPENERLEFLKNHELGLPQADPWMQQRSDAYRDLLRQAYQDEAHYGSKADYIENYLPHLWENPGQARQTFQNLQQPQSLGPKWFQKARYYDLIEAGINNGLKLKTTNPEALVTDRLLSGVDMRQRMELLEQLKKEGLAIETAKAPADILPGNSGGPKNPWMEINAPNRENWLVAPDAQPMWKNAVEARGLWSNEGPPGTVFRGWMALKNAWVPLKLALSAFHPLHVAHISLSNNMSRALHDTFGPGKQSLWTRAKAIPEAMAETIADAFLALPVGTPQYGKTIRKAWLTTPRDQTPIQKEIVRLMNEGGFVPELSEQLKISAKRSFHDALANSQYLKAAGHGIRRAIEKIQAPIFQEWIPNLKASAYMREVESLFQRDPSLLNDPIRRRVSLRAISKQVDNRFGEMFYGSLFWNRTMKDAAIGSFLSLGWNLGFAREFVGGALEPAVRPLMKAASPTRQQIRDVSTKTTNAFIYTMTAFMINAMMNKAMTGEDAQGLDYVFPRIGGNNPDGSPRRITNMFYTREVPMAKKHIEEKQSVVGGLSEMLYHKLMFAPFIEMGTNRDYFGYQIYDPNAPGLVKAQQFLKHVVTEQLNPMSIAGSKRALELSGKPHTTMDAFKNLGDRDVYMPLLGFGPAPAYASKSEMQNRIGYMYREMVAPVQRPFEQKEQMEKRREARTKYDIARQKGDSETMRKAAQELVQLGVKPDSLAKVQPGTQDVYMFSRLPAEAQIGLLKQMSKEEFRRYFPKAVNKVKLSKEVGELHRRFMREGEQ